MALDPSIILAGQAPNVLNALANSNTAAQQRIGFDRENAMNRMLKEQGAGIVAGDQNALAALAGYDPMAALGVQESRLGMDQTRLGMDATRQQMSALDAETKRAAEEYARGLSAEQRAAEAAELEAGVKQALMAPNAQAFDAMMTQMGRPELVGQFDNRQMLAGQFMSVAEILKMNAPSEPQSPAGKLAADLAAGVITTEQYNAELARTAPKGSKISFDPTTGAMSIEEGVGVGGSGAMTVGQAYNPNEIQSVVGMIDAIASDPALPSVVGNKAVALGGGNDVKEMNFAQRIGYGQEGLDVIEKIGQLQSNAWLSARQMLKGGGAITDYESRKAEAAVARLERPKSVADFRAALKELRDAITEGEAKLRAAAGGAPAAPAAPASPVSGKPAKDMSDDEYLQSLGLE